jgi:hypothetical protein
MPRRPQLRGLNSALHPGASIDPADAAALLFCISSPGTWVSLQEEGRLGFEQTQDAVLWLMGLIERDLKLRGRRQANA